MRNDHTWSLCQDGLISREMLLASLGKSQDLTLHTESDKGWYNGEFCDTIMLDTGLICVPPTLRELTSIQISLRFGVTVLRITNGKRLAKMDGI